jgi:hypothetical protein
MKPTEIAKVTNYLRKTFNNNKIDIATPTKRGAPVEMRVGDEFIGVLHRDEDEGEVSYALQIVILEEDL